MLQHVAPLLQTLQRLSISPRVKAKVLTVVCKSLYRLLPQTSLGSAPATLHLAHPALATLAYWLFLKFQASSCLGAFVLATLSA